MRRRGGLRLALFVVLGFILQLVVDAGVFRTVTPHFAGTCRTIPGMVGAEDVEHSKAHDQWFISTDNRPPHPGLPTPDGALWAMPTNGTTPTNLTAGLKLPFDFHPHGMGIFDLDDGVQLWVINHRVSGTTIESFRWKAGALTLVKSLEDPLLMNANDLLGLSATTFLTTHDHGTASHALGKLEDYSRIGRGYVTYFDGSKFLVKATGIRYANGIALRGTGESARVLIASMLGRSILVYRLDAAGDLSYERAIKLDGGPDNVTVDEAGDVWIGLHPKLLALKAMNDDRRQRAPAVVLRVRKFEDEAPEIEEVFADDGRKISAASVAYRLGDRLLIGSVFDDHMLDCTLK